MVSYDKYIAFGEYKINNLKEYIETQYSDSFWYNIWQKWLLDKKSSTYIFKQQQIRFQVKSIKLNIVNLEFYIESKVGRNKWCGMLQEQF